VSNALAYSEQELNTGSGSFIEPAPEVNRSMKINFSTKKTKKKKN
jgi:hypothetical protein